MSRWQLFWGLEHECHFILAIAAAAFTSKAARFADTEQRSDESLARVTAQPRPKARVPPGPPGSAPSRHGDHEA